MALRLDKAKIDLRVSFGPHGNAANAQACGRWLREFKPHVFVMENADISESHRTEFIVRLTKKLADGRKKGSVSVPPETPDEVFLSDIFQLLARSERTVVYFVESHSDSGIVQFQSFRRISNSSIMDSLIHLAAGYIETATEKAMDSLRELAKNVVIPRNRLVVEGFERMLTELPDIYPRIAYADPLRVLARYGTAHAAIVNDLCEHGFNATALYDREGSDCVVDACIGFSRMPEMMVSPEVQTAILAKLVHDEIAGSADDGYGYHTDAMANEAISRVGGVDRFFSLFQEVARIPEAAASFDKFKRIMHEMLFDRSKEVST